MGKNYSAYFLLFALLHLMVSIGFGQGTRESINIDFGSSGGSTPGWNNMTNWTSGTIQNLTTSSGYSTGISIAVTDPFHNYNGVGTTAHDSLGIPRTASGDTFYGNTKTFLEKIVPFGSFTLSNLTVDRNYSFAFFAGRNEATDNREAKYTVEGLSTGSVTLNASNNTSRMVRVSNVRPKADGTIKIIVEKGPNNDNQTGFFYIGTLQVSYASNIDRGPKSVSVRYPNGAGELKAGKDAAIAWDASNVATVKLEYSTDNGASWLPIASGVAASARIYKWRVPAVSSENVLVRVSDSADPAVNDASDQPFTIFQGTNGKVYKIVVLGSSTAAGAGPSKQDSAWVWRYTNYLSHKRSEYNVINLARGGYSTANIIPAGDPERNITKAISLEPDAIIINLPSNDAAVGRSVDQQMANYDLIKSKAVEANVPLWVTTPQPRNFSQDKVQIQLGMIDATYAKFGEIFTVDFWTGFQTDANLMKAMYDSGDGVHMNDAAHRIMLERIIGENISGYLDDGPLGIAPEIGQRVRVFPNPANGNVILQTTGDYKVEKVQLLNVSGQKVLEKGNVGGSVGNLDVSRLAKGLYYMHIQTNKGQFHSKLVVQ